MTYTFAADGDTFAGLQALVLGNTFSASRYGEQAKRTLNDAVTDACRRLGIQRRFEVCDYSATGAVTQPTDPFYRIDEVWLADAGASGSGEQVMARHATYKLEPSPWTSPADAGGDAEFYTVRRTRTPSGLAPALDITVLDAAGAGKVVIAGLARPAAMEDDDDTSGIGADLDWALVAYSKAKLFALEDDADMHNFWMAQYTDTVNTAAQPAHGDGPDITPGTWDEGTSPQRGM